MKIVAMTACVMDIYPQHGIERVGGNAVNFATQCRRSGVEQVSVVGSVGTDAYGGAIVDHLEGMGIDVSHLYRRPGATATNRIYISETGDRTFRPDSWDGGIYQTFRLSPGDWDFVNGHDTVALVSLGPNFEQAMQRVEPRCRRVVDFLDTRDFERLEAYVDRIDVAFMSGDEQMVRRAEEISGSTGALVVVTLGAEGSAALLSGEPFFQPAVGVERVVDTTGCGDAFQAAFTVSWFRHYDVRRALKAGAEAAARVLAQFGAVVNG